MTPTLNQVLASGGTSAYTGFLHFAAALAVVLVAVFSAAKGYTVYRRRRFLPAVMEPGLDLNEIENREKIEKFNFMMDELKRENEKMVLQNNELHNQMLNARRDYESRKQVEDILRKSNVALARECEKLRAEKEELTLKVSAPLIKIRSGRRKPRRVSRKAK
jgi:hypothetical protein